MIRTTAEARQQTLPCLRAALHDGMKRPNQHHTDIKARHGELLSVPALPFLLNHWHGLAETRADIRPASRDAQGNHDEEYHSALHMVAHSAFFASVYVLKSVTGLQ